MIVDKYLKLVQHTYRFHHQKMERVNWTMIWPCCVQARLMMVHTASILSKLFSALFSARTNPGKNIIFPQHQLYDPWQAAGPLFSNTVTPICSLQVSAKYSGGKIKWFCYSWMWCLPLKLYRINYQHILVWRSTNQASVKYLRSPDTQIQLHAKWSCW